MKPLNEKTLYNKWLKARAGIEPQAHVTEKIMTRIESLPSNEPEVLPSDSIQFKMFENPLVKAGLAVALSLLGLIRLAYMSRLILIP